MTSRSIALIVLLLAAGPASAADNPAEAVFVRRVQPLVREKCLACHGGDAARIEGGLDLRMSASLAAGGDSGAALVVAGRPDESPLYLAARRDHETWSAMPPKEAERLTKEQLGWLRDWIAGGAPWPDDERIAALARAHRDQWSAEDGVTVATSGGLAADWTNRRYKPEGLWAYGPVRKPAVDPALAAAHGHPVDALLALRRPAGLAVAPAADRRTLIRRVTFDLTGLPPAPEEVAAFIADPRPIEAAWNDVVERLLASPHYGERMAQHWLDVVRYADSAGFANDFERGNAWRYRDYVVRSFNNDKPYDRFVGEQIAGDEIDPDDPEMLVATGFLRMGPWELTGMEVARVARQRFLDDVTNSVGETFLAQALQCARCHDHKFDPIPTRDYYAVQAVFATTQLAERDAPFLAAENTSGFDERNYLEQRRRDHQATLKRLEEKSLAAAGPWLAERGLDPQPWLDAVAEVRDRQRGNAFTAARNLMLKRGVPEDRFPPRMLGWTPEEIGLERIARKGLERLGWEFDRYEPVALSVYCGRTPQVTSIVAPFRIPAGRMTQGELEATCILTGGDPFAGGAPVRPGVLTVLTEGRPVEVPEGIEGRRRALADWIARGDNPLTTRAIVNRIWLWHFGQPLAGNPNNFGSTGKRPTHPELLDWLAATFVEEEWSMKELHRAILSSAAYRRSAEHPDRRQLSELDPQGTSDAVFRPRRLSAEEIRDAQLAATGELNRTLGGIPNRPEINLEAALQPRQVMGTFAAAWAPNPLPSQRHRRSLYALKLRGLSDPFLEVFNSPAPDFSCERREASTVTPQVFSLFNGKSSHARALALADRAARETSTDEAALDRCFELLLSRRPTAEEREVCLTHWRAVEAGLDPTAAPMPPPLLEVRRDAVEENTGEKFSFRESLPANADFVPDLQPMEVSRHVRALADVCLVLMNTNEFAYVY